MRSAMLVAGLLGICTLCGASQEAPLAVPASCAGSQAASCSGGQAVSNRTIILRRAPVRTFLKNRQGLFSRATPQCGG